MTRLVVALAVLLFAAGCSVQQMAMNRLADALAESGTTFSSDDDPELVGDALPFSLKLMESILAENPGHVGLLTAAASGFTQYSYGWVHQEADEIESEDLDMALYLRDRARRLYLRGRDYGLRGLEAEHPGFTSRLASDPTAAAAMADAGDVPLLYWTAAAWGLAISNAKTDPAMIADVPKVEALIDRALALDEDWDSGAIHSFLITYEPARPGASHGAAERSRRHFDRAVALSNGQLASPYVAYAESVSLQQQNAAEFRELLEKALAIDVDARPEWRLQNLITQRRAAWLLDRMDALFLTVEPETETQGGPS